MKKLLLIILLLCLVSCQKNFNKLTDTDQRSITFRFNPNDYFAHILLHDNGEYHLCTSIDLDEGYNLQITGYCYDTEGMLVAKQQVFGDLEHDLTLLFKHLYRNQQYHFLFMADIVENDSDLYYYEIWFQMHTNELSGFYTTSFESRVDKRYNVLLSANMDVTPDNNTMTVDMNPIAYNGYFVFKNLDESIWSGTIMFYNRMLVVGCKGVDRTEHMIKFPQNQSSFIITHNAHNGDNFFTFNIKKTEEDIVHNYNIRVIDKEHRPFVATIDFASGVPEVTNVKLY